jgi:7,8-dihydropterin-6-yl-methyl-4-(beta-D-ribofuranosyl)aminobenzene 5'-phosphate synthase
MKLTVLLDNNTFIDQYFLGEPGVSYFIEADGKKILFDVGYSDAFLINAQKARIELNDIDFVVLSHGHLDHTWGLRHLVNYLQESIQVKKRTTKATLITSPATFKSRIIKGTREIGPNMTENSLSEFFELKMSASPVYITKNLVYLGEIPRVTSFEADMPLGKVVTDQGSKPDFLLDDSALVYRTETGLVIITGCSHSGICNIVEHAKKVMNDSRILDIIGGLHLLDPSKPKLSGTLDYMKDLKPKTLHACHCTDLRSKIALADVVNLEEVGSGLFLKYL